MSTDGGYAEARSLGGVRLGLALPQYDFAATGADAALEWETIVEYAQLAERARFDSLWLSDHLFLDVGKYGGPDTREFAYEPLVSLAALARATATIRLGTLVLCEALRPASVTAKALATLDVISGGRLDVGIGAGWYEPEYEAIGMTMPSPGVRLARLDEAIAVLDGLLGGGPLDFDGEYQHASGAVVDPPARQVPRPPIVVGGKGDRLLDLVARRADGWNTCWTWTPDAYRERVAVLDAACVRHDRDPASVIRSLGLYALCGEDEADLAARFARLKTVMPPGTLNDDLETWRTTRLVGTPDAIRVQAEVWSELGVSELIVSPGSVPFALGSPDDVEALGGALGGAGQMRR